MTFLDTIAAIATPPGVGAIGVVRVSGSEAMAIARAIVRVGGRPPTCTQRALHVGWVVDPASGERIDEVVLLVFPAPASFTTEDVVEIQGHGGSAVLGRVLGLVLRSGARLAAPGEFTKRAFIGGRLDLAQAEGLLELVEARGERALQGAIGQLSGRLSKAVMATRSAILEILARVEATVDFPDDVSEPEGAGIASACEQALTEMRSLLSGAGAFELARRGARAVLVGRPNVGKSSLLNALLRSERAIVTPLPGTTRDVLEAEVELGGIPVRLLDTAGIRETDSLVEAEGVARSRRYLQEAELRLLVYDATAGFGEEERELLALAGDRPTLLVANKADLLVVASEETARNVLDEPVRSGAGVGKEPSGVSRVIGKVELSALTGDGLPALEAAVVQALLGADLEAPNQLGVNARHRAALERAMASLEGVLATLSAGLPVDLLAMDLRAAVGFLGQITGADPNEELLDLLFSRFCVGK